MAQKTTVFHRPWVVSVGSTVVVPPILRENGTFLEFSLCLSRACLGKMLIFIYKWLKKCRFRTCMLQPSENTSLFPSTFPVCVSRACLGKSSIFLSIKWRATKTFFAPWKSGQMIVAVMFYLKTHIFTSLFESVSLYMFVPSLSW
jgi:hypothetical protein